MTLHIASLLPRLERRTAHECRRGDELGQPAAVPELVLQQVGLEDVSRIRGFRSRIVEETFREYVRMGDIGFYAFWEGALVGHAWAAVSIDSQRCVDGYMRVAPEVACIHYCRVHPDYQGRTIYQHMLTRLTHTVFRTTAAERIKVYAKVWNLASNAALDRLGFRQSGILWTVRWLGRRFRVLSRDVKVA